MLGRLLQAQLIEYVNWCYKHHIDINEDPQPTVMDVYQGKTTLEYKVVEV